ncbi:MAG: hypothetical protein ACI9MC_002480 [Kiritimatiellia bacterium]|jgi:hypothetical protein
MKRSLLFALSLTASCTGNGQLTCQDPFLPHEIIDLSVPPFQQIRRGSVRLRFESTAFANLVVSMASEDQQCVSLVPAQTDRLERTWTAEAEEHGDEAGEYTLYTATMDQMLEGVTYKWKAHTTPSEQDSWTGAVRLPPVAGDGAVVAFTGSMAPSTQRDLFLDMTQDTPDMVLLGGDLQFSETTDSTWSKLMQDVSPVAASSLLHTVAGERDNEEGDELNELYLRWFGGQGRAGGGELYYSVDIAGVRFVVLDSSDPRLSNPSGRQFKWLRTELADVTPQSSLTSAVIVLHNGPWSLADQRPLYELRDPLAELLVDGPVKLVLSSNGQAYERFEVDGIHYVVEGGGGALLSTFTTRAETHPEDVPLQVVASSTHGYTLITIDADGAVSLLRKDDSGDVVDEVQIIEVEPEP